jgi:hypothetical protein
MLRRKSRIFYFVPGKRKIFLVDAEEKTTFLFFSMQWFVYQKFSHFDSIVHVRSSHGRQFSIGCDVARCGWDMAGPGSIPRAEDLHREDKTPTKEDEE